MAVIDVPIHLSGSRLGFTKALRKDPCAYCALKTPTWRESTIDHIVPRANGGADAMGNMTGACPACNQRKGTRSLLLYLLASRGESVPPPAGLSR